ncbi:putative membrane protein [Synechococcus sp. MVIR-18-1]|nr:putative membrane protein [Synechococcus sp. MVIR-18-1]
MVLHWLFKIILLIVSMTYLVVLIRFAFPCKSAAHFNDEQFLNC